MKMTSGDSIGCIGGDRYVLVVESQLQCEGLTLVEGALGAKEVDMPEGEVIVGKENFHLLIVLLDGFVLFLETLAHTQCHWIININSLCFYPWTTRLYQPTGIKGKKML